MQLASRTELIPSFSRMQLNRLNSVPCLTAKMRRAPIAPSTLSAARPFENISIDISGPVTASFAGSIYTVTILNMYSMYSIVSFVKRNSELLNVLRGYRASMESKLHHRGYRLTRIRMYQSGQFCTENGIAIEFSPAFALQSNDAAERLIQEHWVRTRALMVDAEPPQHFWAEVIHHGS